MPYKKKPAFVIELRLDTRKADEDVIDKRMEIGRIIYNKTLNEAMKRYNRMMNDKAHHQLIKRYRHLNRLIKTKERQILKSNDKAELKRLENRLKKYKSEKKQVSQNLSKTQKKYGLTEYDLHSYINPLKHYYNAHFGIHTVQKIASRVWQAMEDLIYKKAKSAHFKKFGQLNSLEGKTNTTGIRFKRKHKCTFKRYGRSVKEEKENVLVWKGLEIPVILRDNDKYVKKALEGKIKYCRIIRKFVGSKHKYYLQLVMKGFPPAKGRKPVEGKVGMDPSLRNMAIVSEKEAHLQELAPNVENIEKEIARLQRKLDRSKRVNNPDNYNKDGTIKKGVKLHWNHSNNYLKILFKLKDLHRKRKALIEQSHNRLANYILTLGNEVYVENMSYKALMKRAKETKKGKSGKYISKKRYGKSIGSKAPAKFLSILERKLKYQGKKLHKVNTWTFKASQYNHVSDTCQKKKLSERWTDVGGDKIQRDLYSAFLIMNSDKNLQYTDRDRCLKTFDRFKELHDLEIKRLKNSNKKHMSSFGLAG